MCVKYCNLRCIEIFLVTSKPQLGHPLAVLPNGLLPSGREAVWDDGSEDMSYSRTGQDFYFPSTHPNLEWRYMVTFNISPVKIGVM